MNKKDNTGYDVEKINSLLQYWFNHNTSHIRENERWLDKIKKAGVKGIEHDLEKAIELSKKRIVILN